MLCNALLKKFNPLFLKGFSWPLRGVLAWIVLKGQ